MTISSSNRSSTSERVTPPPSDPSGYDDPSYVKGIQYRTVRIQVRTGEVRICLKEFCVLFQEQISIYMIKSIYQLPQILHGKTLNIYMVSIYKIYMIPIIVNILTCDILIPINRSFTCCNQGGCSTVHRTHSRCRSRCTTVLRTVPS